MNEQKNDDGRNEGPDADEWPDRTPHAALPHEDQQARERREQRRAREHVEEPPPARACVPAFVEVVEVSDQSAIGTLELQLS